MSKKLEDGKRLNFFVTAKLLQELEDMCCHTGVTYSETLRRSLKKYIEEWKTKNEDGEK